MGRQDGAEDDDDDDDNDDDELIIGRLVTLTPSRSLFLAARKNIRGRLFKSRAKAEVGSLAGKRWRNSSSYSSRGESRSR